MALLALALVGTMSWTGCATEDVVEGDQMDGGDGKSDGSPNVTWNANIANIVPKKVHEYLEKYQWGDYHIVFHMSRKWYLLGDQGRGWLKRVGEPAADLQEGDPGNGLEFLAMHRAMINHLTDRWGTEPVTNDPDGRTEFSDVMKGWTTDQQLIDALTKKGRRRREVPRGPRRTPGHGACSCGARTINPSGASLNMRTMKISPVYEDSVNKKWAGASSASPAAKYGTAFGGTGIEDAVSKFHGIDAQASRTACTQTSECNSSLGESCAKRDGATSGRCIPTWWGICHAWAPAAILLPEPKKAVTYNNVEFKIQDIKALLTLVHDRTETKFVSLRCDGLDRIPIATLRVGSARPTS